MIETKKKSRADDRAFRLRRERARLAAMDADLLRPQVLTWSATMPAYCYTVLCVDLERRMPLVNMRYT